MAGESSRLCRVTHNLRQMEREYEYRFSLSRSLSPCQQTWGFEPCRFDGNDQTITTMFHGNFVVHKICFELLRSEPEVCCFFFNFLWRDVSNKDGASAQMYAKAGRSATMSVSVPSQRTTLCSGGWRDVGEGVYANCICALFCLVSKF